jgi:hypothetical protein
LSEDAPMPKMKTIIPDSITPKIRELCQSINPKAEPYYVDVSPDLAAAAADNCFPNVAAKVARDGGEMVSGWIITEWPRVMVEAQFHANWKSPDGKIIDITPKPFPRILFLPDESRRFEDKRIDNIRLALSDDNDARQFVVALAEWERLTGDKVGVNRVPDTPELQRAVAELKRLYPIMDAR